MCVWKLFFLGFMFLVLTLLSWVFLGLTVCLEVSFWIFGIKFVDLGFAGVEFF